SIFVSIRRVDQSSSSAQPRTVSTRSDNRASHSSRSLSLSSARFVDVSTVAIGSSCIESVVRMMGPCGSSTPGKPVTFYQDERRPVPVRGDGMIHTFAALLERSRKPSRLVVGLMSGTSADSIDAAICRMTGQGAEVGVELLHYRERAHDPDVKRRVIGLATLD